MSEEGSFGITLAEKFFGFLLILIGALLTYYTLTSMDTLGAYTGFFGFLSLIPLILGIFLLIARTE
ncbi:hypothetical protein HXY33_06585 [Candidatus Bathyarchaeota archaeon]|nr:hypothetical protein [Candidatus Bathyarchaeota archaeon]